jgi:hypothetical protein
MAQKANTYVRQKPILYFDENFPTPVVESIGESRRIRKYFKMVSVHDFDNEGKDDEFQLAFCKIKGFV